MFLNYDTLEMVCICWSHIYETNICSYIFTPVWAKL